MTIKQPSPREPFWSAVTKIRLLIEKATSDIAELFALVRTMPVAAATFTITGQDVGFSRTTVRTLPVGVASVTLTGGTVAFAYSGSTGIVGAGSQALTNSTTTTAVTVAGLAATDQVVMFPADAGAASLEGQDSYISAVSSGSFTITHANSTVTRTFRWVAVRPPA